MCVSKGTGDAQMYSVLNAGADHADNFIGEFGDDNEERSRALDGNIERFSGDDNGADSYVVIQSAFLFAVMINICTYPENLWNICNKSTTVFFPLP